jgi:hypothetical protein
VGILTCDCWCGASSTCGHAQRISVLLSTVLRPTLQNEYSRDGVLPGYAHRGIQRGRQGTPQSSVGAHLLSTTVSSPTPLSVGCNLVPALSLYLGVLIHRSSLCLVYYKFLLLRAYTRLSGSTYPSTQAGCAIAHAFPTFFSHVQVCSSYILLPAENMWSPSLRAFMYLAALIWAFYGIGALISPAAQKDPALTQPLEIAPIPMDYSCWGLYRSRPSPIGVEGIIGAHPSHPYAHASTPRIVSTSRCCGCVHERNRSHHQ